MHIEQLLYEHEFALRFAFFFFPCKFDFLNILFKFFEVLSSPRVTGEEPWLQLELMIWTPCKARLHMR